MDLLVVFSTFRQNILLDFGGTPLQLVVQVFLGEPELALRLCCSVAKPLNTCDVLLDSVMSPWLYLCKISGRFIQSLEWGAISVLKVSSSASPCRSISKSNSFKIQKLMELDEEGNMALKSRQNGNIIGQFPAGVFFMFIFHWIQR